MLAAALLLGTASADPLDPRDFAGSYLALPAEPVFVDTIPTPPTIGFGGQNHAGVVTPEGVAVFAFDGDLELLGVTFNRGPNARPCAFLATGDLTVSGVVDASADRVVTYQDPGPGGGAGGDAKGVAGAGTGGGRVGSGSESGAGGGGFGGAGGTAGRAAEALGGDAYGDLRIALEGGSGGAHSDQGGNSAPGGGGGGALHLGALGQLRLAAGARIDLRGANGANDSDDGGGAGSGGGLVLQGRAGSGCDASAELDARGGAGGFGGKDGGGGGGGGRVLAIGFDLAGCVVRVDGGGAGGGSGGGQPGTPGAIGEAVSWDPDGDVDGVSWGVDCDDFDAAVGAPDLEIVGDGIDQDCDGVEVCYLDEDVDGYRVASTARSLDTTCDANGLAYAGDPAGDCDDRDDTRNPGLAEVPGDGIDQDCDAEELCFVDADLDGFRTDDAVASGNLTCDLPGEALAEAPPDCDDLEALVNPGAAESPCDTVDNDCAPGTLDDPDGDGDGTSVCANDCDDVDPDVNPGATEVCNGVDDDCDAGVDEGLVFDAAPDTDRDGFGDDGAVEAVCTLPTDWTSVLGDCDDGDAAVNPGGADDTCDGVDQDCTGAADEGFTTRYYADADRDGHGDPGAPIDACAPPPDTSAVGDDCDDTTAAVSPEATELACNGRDDDCDAGTLDGPDEDEDGVASCDGVPDCDDADPEIPREIDLDCNEVDDDCDPTTPDGADFDGDGFPDCADPCAGGACDGLADAGCSCASDPGPAGAFAVGAALAAAVRRRRPTAGGQRPSTRRRASASSAEE